MYIYNISTITYKDSWGGSMLDTILMNCQIFIIVMNHQNILGKPKPPADTIKTLYELITSKL